jgi:MraZ protein
MIDILGGYQGTLDAKARFLLPAAFKKQLSEEESIRFVMTKGLDNCVSLFTLTTWAPFKAKIASLNGFGEKQRIVKRFFLDTAVYVEPDSAGRLLVPAHLKEHAGLEKDLTMCWSDDKLEIWDSNKYKQFFDSISPAEISRITDEVLGGSGSNG